MTPMGSVEHCFHCGEPVPEGVELFVAYAGQARAMCCPGCQAVAQLIAGTGLDNYYRFRQQLARRVGADFDASRQAWKAVDQRAGLWGTPLPHGLHDLLLQTEGIRCAACAWLIRSHLEGKPGIDAVQVDAASGFTHIRWNPRATRLSHVADALFELGYTPHLPIASAEEEGRRKARRNSMQRLGVAGLGMMQVMMYAVGLYAGEAKGISPAERGFLTWVSLLVTLPVVFYAGRVFFIGAIQGLRASRPGMDVPVALAIGIAFSASCFNFFRGHGEVWFDSVVMFIFFLTLGRHIELILRQRNLQAGSALARLMPEWAERVLAKRTETVPASDLLNGDCVRVQAGAVFPADGRIIRGTTEVDEALLTGESNPLPRATGEAVVAGSVNLTQSVEVRVTAVGSASTVSSLGRLVLAAQSRRSHELGMPGWLVPAFITAVLLAALGTWLFWHFQQADQALPAMLAVLVASCPCALSLALPAVYSAASQGLLLQGILLTRGDALHELTHIDTVVFDKTGTLTRGYPTLVRTHLNPARTDIDATRALAVAAAIEAHSLHPVARAFRPSQTPLDASAVQSCPGQGLEGRVDGISWRIGQAGFVGMAERTGSPGTTTDPVWSEIWLADQGGWCARFELSDTLREGGEQTIAALSQAKMQLYLCSGDSAQAATAVAARLGIRDVLSRQSPAMKLAFIRDLQHNGHSVLMVGDGINDGPVLAAADVSVTVKGASELANSAADLILTGDSLALLGRAIEVAQKATRLVRQNMVWALLYNASVLPLAMSGVLQPWMAAAGMSLSSLLVVANAARLSPRPAHGQTLNKPARTLHRSDLTLLSKH